ncbi:MAG TPA: M23 family metallopeptidase [Longimicrobiaceae bacterium]|nr:M23 family metallopeptidase [Longimicrobiaceae bacterium]
MTGKLKLYRRALGALVLLLTIVTPLGAQSDPAIERGRALNDLLLSGATDSVFTLLSDELRAAVGGKDGLAQFSRTVNGGLGEETAIVEEAIYSIGPWTQYYRISRFSGLPDQTVTASWAWATDGEVTSMTIRPTPEPAATDYADYQTKAALQLPFKGEWYVFWGGRTPHQNYHVVAPDQRFAYDLLIVRNGGTHKGDGKQNTDYYCFGQPILAPAAGRVVTAVDSLPDNLPGVMNPAAPAGNHVIIDHGDDEFSLLGHLQSGSVTVEVGDTVESGETLGMCGNSGNSSEPHLHHHLQTEGSFGEGVGLPVYFNGYWADGEYVERGEPVRGQAIRPGSPH